MVSENFLRYMKWAKELKRRINSPAPGQQQSAPRQEGDVTSGAAQETINCLEEHFLSSPTLTNYSHNSTNSKRSLLCLPLKEKIFQSYPGAFGC